MIDFNNLEKYRENNRIEAKNALGGLPKSVWETYSAFANTLGGIILLGVAEWPDHSLHPVDLPDPYRYINEFWDIVNDPAKTSVNVLSSRDLFVQVVEGCHIVVINVPRAGRSCRPVYVNGSSSCTYRRNGEGDYRCSREEYEAMVRDASVKTQDMRILKVMDLDSFNGESICRYRQRMSLARPGHVWENLADEDFLQKLGAAAAGNDGRVHPTSAGLLMFGREHEIVRIFNTYYLEYQEQNDSDPEEAGHILSSSGDWSGNVYDFYVRVCSRLTGDIALPSGKDEETDTAIKEALQEALVNCLVNADYYGRQGVSIIKKKDSVTMTNPGRFRIGIDAARSGGVSDPRNAVMMTMFNLIDIGEHTGGGIPNMFRVWRRQGWAEPVISESFKPDRITLSLTFGKSADVRTAVKISDEKTVDKTQIKESIVMYLTDHIKAADSEIAEALGLELSRTRECLRDLTAADVMEEETDRGKRLYKLKA